MKSVLLRLFILPIAFACALSLSAQSSGAFEGKWILNPDSPSSAPARFPGAKR